MFSTASTLQMQIVQTQLNVFNANIDAGSKALDQSYEQLYYIGTPLLNSAEATYTYGDLNTVVPSLGNLPLTNGDCSRVNTALTAADLGAVFEEKITQLLAVTFDGFELNGDIVCVPAMATQTRADQAAYFKLSFNVTAYYGFFPNNPSYVLYASSGLNHTQQPSEAQSAMGIGNVAAQLQRVLRTIVLESSQETLRMLWIAS